MDFINAFLDFFKKFFAALTAFLGRSIPFVSDLAGLDFSNDAPETEPETEG